MALDFTNNGLNVPEGLDFTTRTEPTRMAGKKYIINNDTDEVIGIVGSKFNSVTHTEFYDRVWETMSNQLGEEAMEGVQVKWNTARNNAFAMLDATMPSTKALITTDKHQTEVSQRVIALHGVDGLCSNQVFFGSIDFFCTNGMIRGEHDKVRRKNTTNFNMATFIKELENANSDFYSQAEQLQEWARTPLLCTLRSLTTHHMQMREMVSSYVTQAMIQMLSACGDVNRKLPSGYHQSSSKNWLLLNEATSLHV
jgi:hypothetical protein